MDEKKKFYLNKVDLRELKEDESGEFVQLIPPALDENNKSLSFKSELPILPIKNTVLFPGVVIPITVSRKKSIKLVQKAYKDDRTIGVVAQKNTKVEDPLGKDLFEIGTLAKILKMLVLPDGNTTIIIQGQQRFHIDEIINVEPYITAKVTGMNEDFPNANKKETKAIIATIKDTAFKIMNLNPEIPQEAQIALDNIDNPVFLTHFLSSNINAEVNDKQKLLEINNGLKRANLLLEYLTKDLQMLELRNEIQKKVNSDIDQQQRDYYIRQQIKVLQDELGYEGPDQEMEDMRMKADKKNWAPAVKLHFNKELEKIQRMNPAAAEFPVAMNYVEFLVDLPWNDITRDDFDLIRARKILNHDHYGLEKVKERILEYLAVLKLKQDIKGPILCLYGPPGVGKTSLGKSIAKALKRKYVRISLGGLHDEAEIRGHRKTYVGAMPGKILQNIKKVKYSNPVFVLDEIDKVSSDFRGDPASALLEVLDPEQNNTFVDNYLEIEYDLSKVLFIATANTLETIHPALRDRMEVIEINGYTLEEKLAIAKRHLIPKQRREHGLKTSDVNFSDTAVTKIIESYTKESGVRNLDREIGSVMRNIAKTIAMKERRNSNITPARVEKILGPAIYDKELYQNSNMAGVVIGLAWTQYGGEILFVESNLSKGKGKLTLSGQLGDVMKESAMAALSYLKSHAEKLGIDYRVFEQYDLHIHVPAGAVPKDGPSAGITIFTSLASAFTQRKVKEKLAMTGEITLRGKVLPVGGIKEKILAAKRSGIREIILCKANRKDILEINKSYISDLTIHYVENAEEVVRLALLNEKVKNPRDFKLEEKTVES